MAAAAPKIGTAGWSIPSIHRGEFATSGSCLARYSQKLNSVEINSSFSKTHRVSTYERWRNSVGPDFRFSVKLPKVMSHTKGLEDCGSDLARFADEVAGLEEKLAVVLVQVPPKLAFDQAVVGSFFSSARSLLKSDLAVEPRHASWFTEETNEFLVKHRVSRVAAHPVRYGDGAPGGSPGLVYYRLHGAPHVYYSEYEPSALEKLNEQLRQSAGAETWCIFDNTASGAALGNALWLSRRQSE